jgi:hypothetical protein
MNEANELSGYEPETEVDVVPDQDDRYPGSFFRIPKPLVLGETGWHLS